MRRTHEYMNAWSHQSTQHYHTNGNGLYGETHLEDLSLSVIGVSQSLLAERGPLAEFQSFEGLNRVRLLPPVQPGQWSLHARTHGPFTFNIIGENTFIISSLRTFMGICPSCRYRGSSGFPFPLILLPHLIVLPFSF